MSSQGLAACVQGPGTFHPPHGRHPSSIRAPVACSMKTTAWLPRDSAASRCELGLRKYIFENPAMSSVLVVLLPRQLWQGPVTALQQAATAQRAQ